MAPGRQYKVTVSQLQGLVSLEARVVDDSYYYQQYLVYLCSLRNLLRCINYVLTLQRCHAAVCVLAALARLYKHSSSR